MAEIINRRKFFKDTSLSTAGLILGSSIAGCTSQREESVSNYNLMKEVMKYRKIDAHAHVYFNDRSANFQLDSGKRLGIGWQSFSRPVSGTGASSPDVATPEEVRRCNDLVHQVMKQHPDEAIGFFTLNPYYTKESIEEIKRCVDLGFRGYKGYTQVKVNDPLYFPVIEKLIDLKMLCFMHAECEFGVGGYRMKYDKRLPSNATIPEDMVDAAKRYPEAIFQWAHIASGDFEYISKCIKDYPNIYIDVSGSNNDEKHVDFCIKQLGEDRIFFGSDNSYYQSVGKILASNATEVQREKIFFDNYNNVLKKGGYNVA